MAILRYVSLMSMSDFEIVKTTTGATSIRNKVVNEIMHNPIGPWLEANALYVDQSELRNQLTNGLAEDFVLFDVGLGSASNAVASLDAALKLGGSAPRRRLHIVSFENNMALLEFTLLNAHEFAHLRGYEAVLAEILNHHHWTSPCGSVVWDLRVGDFLQVIVTEPMKANLIFFDPYSPAVNEEMWTLKCFQQLRLHCADSAPKDRDNISNSGPTNLYTYSIATPVRSAMILAGFYVGYGLSTGLKTETTQAATQFCALKNPLAERWFKRWQRSHKPLPFDATDDQGSEFRRFIVSHEQFHAFLS